MESAKAWEEIEIKNDFLFAKVMSDKEICKALLEMLLQIRIQDIVYWNKQKAIDVEKDAKSVRLDVYVEDGNRIFDLEMQTTDKKDLPWRSRYYQGMMDLNTIEKGESYKKLKESYVIFICTFDPFKSGKAQYTFENMCREESSLKLGDGTKKIFFNTKDYMHADKEDVREFLKYVNGGDSSHPFVKEIKERVKRAKSNEEWRREYMTLLMRDQENREIGREEGRKEGRREGREQERQKIIIKMIKQGFSDEQIILLCDTSKDEIRNCREMEIV